MADDDVWRREVVLNQLKRVHASGEDLPLPEELRVRCGLGERDFRETLALLVDEAVYVVVEDGKYRYVEPDENPPEPLDAVEVEPDDAETVVVPDPSPALPEPPLPPSRLDPKGIRHVELTPGMLDVLEPTAIGDLVKAGVEDAKRADLPFVLVVR